MSARTMSRWEALAILMVLAFLNYMDRNLVFPLLNPIGKGLNLSETQLGALATGFHVVYAFSAPMIGYLSDRLARKTILLIALVSWSIVTALSGTATGFVSLLLWRSLTGLGEGGYFPTAVSLIGDLFDRDQRGRAIALHGVCTTLGGSAGYAIGGALGQALGWRAPFFLAVAPGLLLAVVVWRRFVEPPRGAFVDPEVSHASAGRRDYLHIIGSVPVLLIAGAAAAGNFAMNALNTFFPKFLADTRQFSVASAGVASGCFYASTLLGQLGGGLLSDRLATRVAGLRPLLVAVAFVVAAPAAAGLGAGGPIAIVLCAYGLTQVGRGFAEPNLYGTIIDAVPAQERGSAQGFLLALTFAGASASPLMTGFCISRFGYSSAFLMVALSLALAAGLAAVLCWWLRRRTVRQEV